MVSNLDNKKNISYYHNVRNDVLRFIIPEGKRILDVGCGLGSTGLELKRRGAKEVVGVEYVAEVATRAAEVLDSVYHGDIDQINLNFALGYFDYILCLDVLEHLPYPENTLRKLTPYLSESGNFIISLPNVRYLGTIYYLIFKADWPRKSAGVFDGTHLRWFTAKSILRMFADLRLSVRTYHRNTLKPLNKIRFIDSNNTINKMVPDWFTTQFIFVVEKRLGEVSKCVQEC